VNRLAFVLGIAVLAIAFATAPMPLVVTLENPTRDVTIYPNVLFAVPLILLGVLLVLYGATARGPESEVNQRSA
jgi:peptidoglycan/LPS O-acetylase OafA/YrhL